MYRIVTLLTAVSLFSSGCGPDLPTAQTGKEAEALQEAAQKEADEGERNMKDGSYDPAAPKKSPKRKQ